MAIVRWDPWRELAGFERQFDELFGRGRAGSRGQGMSTWVPALDVHQDGDTMVIRAEIAGVDPDNVEITIDDDVLTMSGKREDDRKVEEGQWIRRERVTGQFRRSISLPPGVDPDKVKAAAKHGVIEIRVPRPSPAEPHRVQLSSGNGHKSTEVEVESGSKSRSSERMSTRSSGGATKKSTKSSRRPS
jgi:HSP20 family protein